MTKDEALKLALDALNKCNSALAEELAAWDIDPPLHHVLEASNACGAAITAIKEYMAQPEQEPVAASKKDEVFAASIEFIGTLTGMTPPPIEVAPPEVFKPFRDFTEKVCSILATPPQRKPLTDDLYNELLFAVGNKYPNETRHQTALRYILQAEKGDAKAVYGIKE